MDIERAKEILTILSDGINPITGEVLPYTDSCNQADVVRAIHSVITEINNLSKKAKKVPENSGKLWTKDEEIKLVFEYRNGYKVYELAKKHGRTSGSIRSRLIKLGEISDQLE